MSCKADEENKQPRRSMFIDFMYAIVVGAAFPALSGDRLDLSNIGFWSILFLLSVVLEDYYLYETQIVRHQQAGDVPLMALLFEIVILVSWYIAIAAISSATASTPASNVAANVAWFLSAFSAFFLLKLFAGVAHWTAFHKKELKKAPAEISSSRAFWKGIALALRDPRCSRNFFFLIPSGTALIILLRCRPKSPDGLTLLLLFVTWVAMAVIWWAFTVKKQIT